MSEKGSEAVVYGLSSEGYKIASSLVNAAIPTTLIDENLGIGMGLKLEAIRAFKTARDLITSETLVGFEPSERSIKRARVVFVCPKLRKPFNETKIEIANRVREVSKSITGETLLLSCLPAGVGENAERISTVEKLAGLQNSSDFQYLYLPLDGARTAGSTSKLGDDDLDLLSKAGLVSSCVSIDEAELKEADSLLKRYSTMASSLEFCKRMASWRKQREEKHLETFVDSFRNYYIDDLAARMTDLHLLASSLETGDPLLYLASGTNRSVEGYVRYLIQEIREVAKEKELKASKVRIILVWTLDDYEMRGDRLAMLSSLNERLRDYFGDIEVVTNPTSRQQRDYLSLLPITTEKTNIVVACSEADSENLTKMKSDGVGQRQLVLVKANLLVEEIH